MWRKKQVLCFCFPSGTTWAAHMLLGKGLPMIALSSGHGSSAWLRLRLKLWNWSKSLTASEPRVAPRNAPGDTQVNFAMGNNILKYNNLAPVSSQGSWERVAILRGTDKIKMLNSLTLTASRIPCGVLLPAANMGHPQLCPGGKHVSMCSNNKEKEKRNQWEVRPEMWKCRKNGDQGQVTALLGLPMKLTIKARLLRYCNWSVQNKGTMCCSLMSTRLEKSEFNIATNTVNCSSTMVSYQMDWHHTLELKWSLR